VDGDGDLDLAVGNWYDNNEVYLNSGTALATTPAWTSSNSTATNSVAWGDVDGDGELDLAVGNDNGNNEVYLNSGTALAAFPTWTDSNSLNTYSVAWGDVDGDGDLDLAVGNNGNNEVYLISPDADGDWFTDDNDDLIFDPTQSVDSDGDGHGDNPQGRLYDSCTGYGGDSWRDRWGCPDMDSDGQSDLYDDFMTKYTQWLDSDGDGLGDNWGDPSWTNARKESWPGQYIADAIKSDPSPLDYDNDGFEDDGISGAEEPFDDCLLRPGKSFRDSNGCPDADLDGWSDEVDAMPGNPTQWLDSDGDGYGDNSSGMLADDCPDVAGNSTRDKNGCIDNDGDGWSIFADDADDDPFENSDTDGDGIGDNGDKCPLEFGTITTGAFRGCPDLDGDGVGDSSDALPEDASQWLDSDRDGFGENMSGTTPDDCPTKAGYSFEDRFGCPDRDGDGWSDPDDDWQVSDGADALINEPTQWRDRDGDGFGDSPSGKNADSCPDDFGTSTETFPGCTDNDGDGTPDSFEPLAYRDDPAVWSDADNDGWADQLGTNRTDNCPSQPGNSSISMMGCPDMDGDGIPDLLDPDADGDGILNSWEYQMNPSFDPFDADEVPVDTDGDGIPDYFDDDDDGDGFPDAVEKQRGSDPFSSSSDPVSDSGGGFFYVPGEGFQSGYHPDGYEISFGAVINMMSSEFLAPLLIAPLTIYFMLSKRRRFKTLRDKTEEIHDLGELELFEEQLDELIGNNKLKITHALLIRNILERRQDILRGHSSDIHGSSLPPVSGGMATPPPPSMMPPPLMQSGSGSGSGYQMDSVVMDDEGYEWTKRDGRDVYRKAGTYEWQEW
jgi:hypothetical protein